MLKPTFVPTLFLDPRVIPIQEVVCLLKEFQIRLVQFENGFYKLHSFLLLHPFIAFENYFCGAFSRAKKPILRLFNMSLFPKFSIYSCFTIFSPFSVSKYRCLGCFGLSGNFICIKFSCNAGSR